MWKSLNNSLWGNLALSIALILNTILADTSEILATLAPVQLNEKEHDQRYLVIIYRKLDYIRQR